MSETLFHLKLTQFLMPNGRRKEISVALPGKLQGRCKEILDEGFTFSCEMLQTGAIALYISDDAAEEDLVCEIAENGPGPQSPKNVLTRMIEIFKNKREVRDE